MYSLSCFASGFSLTPSRLTFQNVPEKQPEAPKSSGDAKKGIDHKEAGDRGIDEAKGKLDKVASAEKVHQLAANRDASIAYVNKVLANAQDQTISSDELNDLRLAAQGAIDALKATADGDKAAREDMLLKFIYPIEAFALRSLK